MDFGRTTCVCTGTKVRCVLAGMLFWCRTPYHTEWPECTAACTKARCVRDTPPYHIPARSSAEERACVCCHVESTTTEDTLYARTGTFRQFLQLSGTTVPTSACPSRRRGHLTATYPTTALGLIRGTTHLLPQVPFTDPTGVLGSPPSQSRQSGPKNQQLQSAVSQPVEARYHSRAYPAVPYHIPVAFHSACENFRRHILPAGAVAGAIPGSRTFTSYPACLRTGDLDLPTGSTGCSTTYIWYVTREERWEERERRQARKKHFSARAKRPVESYRGTSPTALVVVLVWLLRLRLAQAGPCPFLPYQEC